jgi:hypothetical protein
MYQQFGGTSLIHLQCPSIPAALQRVTVSLHPSTSTWLNQNKNISPKSFHLWKTALLKASILTDCTGRYCQKLGVQHVEISTGHRYIYQHHTQFHCTDFTVIRTYTLQHLRDVLKLRLPWTCSLWMWTLLDRQTHLYWYTKQNRISYLKR